MYGKGIREKGGEQLKVQFIEFLMDVVLVLRFLCKAVTNSWIEPLALSLVVLFL